MEIAERGERDARRAELLPGTGDGIEHPRRDNNDHARRHLDMDDRPRPPVLAALPSQTTPVQRMPAVVDDDFLPDMGRMSGRLPSAARPGSSPAPTAAARGPPSCTA